MTPRAPHDLPPRFRSLRWRLLLSYALIALLAAVALGGVLLFTLRSYYARREQAYMVASADLITRSAAQLLSDDVPPDVLQAATDVYAFVALSRVQVLDAEGRALSDSGPITDESFVSLDYLKPQNPLGVPTDAPNERGAEMRLSVGRAALLSEVEAARMFRRRYALWSWRKVLGQLLPGDADATRRSERVLRVPLRAPEDEGALLGYVQLSEAPSFGAEIVDDVARKAAVAGVVAVLLAGVAGWFASLRITRPLSALTRTTVRMAEGDLSVRAELDRRDEVGVLARAFDTMAARVEETVRTLQRFVADAAHEINTPITALRTHLELAATDAQAEQMRADLTHAQAELTRLETLTRGLLTLARVEGQGAALRVRAVDVAALLRQLHERYASRAEQAGLELRVELEAPAAFAQLDDALLSRVLENLLDNALKFTPAGGHVTLGLRAEPQALLLWVEDDGIGVPPDDLPRLFSRFYRASNAAAYPGNGLGLAISRAIVEAHGGQIAVRSAAGRTRFELRLPREGGTP